MDQRKVNMLAREYCDEVKPKKKFKPVILSHRKWRKVEVLSHCMFGSWINPSSLLGCDDCVAKTSRAVVP